MKFISAVLLAALSGICLSNTSGSAVYPPLFSSSFPLSTPVAFWASTLGMRRLAADIVWVQALQYYSERDEHIAENGLKDGDEKKDPYPELKSHWQQVVRLDPLFTEAYLTGPVTLGWNLKRYDQAFALLDEGIEAVSLLKERLRSSDMMTTGSRHLLMTGSGPYLEELVWKLYTLKTVLIYLDNDRFSDALPALERLSARENIPDTVKSVLAQLYARNGFYEKSLILWYELYSTTEDQALRDSAERNIIELADIISSDLSPL